MTNLQVALLAAVLYLASDPGGDTAKIERLALHWHEWLSARDGSRDDAARRLRERENR